MRACSDRPVQSRGRHHTFGRPDRAACYARGLLTATRLHSAMADAPSLTVRVLGAGLPRGNHQQTPGGIDEQHSGQKMTSSSLLLAGSYWKTTPAWIVWSGGAAAQGSRITPTLHAGGCARSRRQMSVAGTVASWCGCRPWILSARAPGSADRAIAFPLRSRNLDLGDLQGRSSLQARGV